MSSKKICLKHNNIIALGWSIETKTSGYKRYFQNKKFSNDIQNILTGTTIEQSASEREKNPDL